MSAQPVPPNEPGLHPVHGYQGGPEMTLLEHLKELRNRVIVSAIAVVIGILVCAIFWERILDFLLEPAPEETKLYSFTPFDRITIIFKIALYGGVIIASPVVIYEFLAFIIPGLTPRERKMLAPGMIGAVLFLLAGMAFAYWILLPTSLDFLFHIGEDKFVTAIGAPAYISFVTRIIFWMGVAFEMPIVLALLARFGVVRARQLLRFWRYAVIIIAVLAALITPTPDPLNMTLTMAPLFALYFVGILLAWIVQKPRPGPRPV
jgi:sec-independent protein translocase protein TatC